MAEIPGAKLLCYRKRGSFCKGTDSGEFLIAGIFVTKVSAAERIYQPYARLASETLKDFGVVIDTGCSYVVIK